MVPTRVFFGACFLLCLMVIPSFGGIPKYEIVELTTPSEKGCGSIALNDRGEVLFRVHNDRNVTTHYLWTPEKGRVELANLGDGITSVIDLNDQGWMIGYRVISATDPRVDAAVRDWESQQERLKQMSQVRRISERPSSAPSETEQATSKPDIFDSTPNQRRPFPILPNRPMPTPVEPFIWKDDQLQTTEIFGNKFGVRVTNLNNRGDILGSDGQGFLIWTNQGEKIRVRTEDPNHLIRNLRNFNDAGVWVGDDARGNLVSNKEFPDPPPEIQRQEEGIRHITNRSELLVRCATIENRVQYERFFIVTEEEWIEMDYPSSLELVFYDMNDDRVAVGKAYKITLEERLRKAGVGVDWKWIETLSNELESMEDYYKFACIYHEGEFEYLEDRVVNPDGWENLSSAKAINNKGQILGEGIKNGVKTLFLLNPIGD
ncbi:MAG: hypothetical protein KC994_19950 [Candidatus Omnitrophica bacterium]|nr:hypothetical protein [Candidatus Omnitrophota bacterium]